MNETEIQDFVTRFAAAWAARDGEAFFALWHPDGMPQSPLYDGRSPARNWAGSPSWCARAPGPCLAAARLDGPRRGGDRRMAGDTHGRWKAIDWRGVDKFRLRAGRIAEERVYMDTAALRAARGVAWPEPLMRLD